LDGNRPPQGRKPGGGRHWDFATDQAERARLLKALHGKGATLSQLARANLTFDSGQAFVIYDGHELRACRDAAAAIARWCERNARAQLSIWRRSARALRNESCASPSSGEWVLSGARHQIISGGIIPLG
jgi:hypothetical protein